MKESNWDDCKNMNNAIRITPDKEKAKSLLETADARIKYSSKTIDANNVNFIFEDYYSSIIETIHAIALLQGYKIVNHVCLGFYLRDTLKRGDLFMVFDDLRYKRNSLTYYGKRMDFATAKNAVEKSEDLVKKLHEFLLQL